MLLLSIAYSPAVLTTTTLTNLLLPNIKRIRPLEQQLLNLQRPYPRGTRFLESILTCFTLACDRTQFSTLEAYTV